MNDHNLFSKSVTSFAFTTYAFSAIINWIDTLTLTQVLPIIFRNELSQSIRWISFDARNLCYCREHLVTIRGLEREPPAVACQNAETRPMFLVSHGRGRRAQSCNRTLISSRMWPPFNYSLRGTRVDLRFPMCMCVQFGIRALRCFALQTQ